MDAAATASPTNTKRAPLQRRLDVITKSETIATLLIKMKPDETNWVKFRTPSRKRCSAAVLVANRVIDGAGRGKRYDSWSERAYWRAAAYSIRFCVVTRGETQALVTARRYCIGRAQVLLMN